MRLTITIVVGCLFVARLVGSPWEEPVRAVKVVERSNDGNRPLRARAIVRGPNGIEGEVLASANQLKTIAAITDDITCR